MTDNTLEEERDALLASLRDLEKERAEGDLVEVDYQALHDNYTARAAAVIRALESEGGTTVTTTRAAGEPLSRRNGPSGSRLASPRRSLGVTLAVVAGIVVLAVGAVMVFAGGRDAGQPLSGSLPAGPETVTPGDPTTAKLAQAVELDGQGRGVDALKLYDEILRDQPDNPAALAYRGWLLKRAGLTDEALVALDRAVAVAPEFADAHFFRGMVLFQDRADPAGAVAEFEAFLRNDPPPEMVSAVVQVLERARSAVKEAGGTTGP